MKITDENIQDIVGVLITDERFMPALVKAISDDGGSISARYLNTRFDSVEKRLTEKVDQSESELGSKLEDARKAFVAMRIEVDQFREDLS